MTGKEYHRLIGMVEHFKNRSKEWGDHAARETDEKNRAGNEGKAKAYCQAADDLKKLLEDMNS